MCHRFSWTLCNSYTFIKRILAVTFYYFLFLTENFHNVCPISAGSEKRYRISPYTPIVKIAYFGNVIFTDIPQHTHMRARMHARKTREMQILNIRTNFRKQHNIKHYK